MSDPLESDSKGRSEADATLGGHPSAGISFEPLQSHGLLQVAAESDIGLKRTNNEDRYADLGTPWGQLLVVADGLGGHRAGERASEMVVTRLRQRFCDTPHEWDPGAVSFDTAIKAVMQEINREVYAEGHGGNPEHQGMGSTVAMVLINGNEFVTAHAGDSRVYIYRRGRLRQLTSDHTVGDEMVKGGVLTRAQADEHPEATLLTRMVGDETLDIAVGTPGQIREGDVFLVCSDGLSGPASDREIAGTIGSCESVTQAARALITLALQKGGPDNVTVVLGCNSAWPRPPLIRLPEIDRIRALTLFAGATVLAVMAGGGYLWKMRSRTVGVPLASPIATHGSASNFNSPPLLPALPRIQDRGDAVPENRNGVETGQVRPGPGPRSDIPTPADNQPQARSTAPAKAKITWDEVKIYLMVEATHLSKREKDFLNGAGEGKPPAKSLMYPGSVPAPELLKIFEGGVSIQLFDDVSLDDLKGLDRLHRLADQVGTHPDKRTDILRQAFGKHLNGTKVLVIFAERSEVPVVAEPRLTGTGTSSAPAGGRAVAPTGGLGADKATHKKGRP